MGDSGIRRGRRKYADQYVFLSYLLGLIPPDQVEMIDLEGKLKLEYYKLQKTYEGSIDLRETATVLVPVNARSVASPEKKLPLDEIIDKINEQYNGTFTDADRVVVSAMKDKLMADEKLQTMAKTSDPQIFNDSVFPKFFNLIAQDCYTESQDAFTSLFADQAKYNAVMHALSSVIYRDMRKTV